MAKSREVRKLDQKRATSSTESGTMLRLGTFTRSRLIATRGRQGPSAFRRKKLDESRGDLAGSIGKLVADGALGDGHAVINGGRGRPRLLAGLKPHIFKERRLGQITFHNVRGVVNALPPANKVQQVVSVSAQGRVPLCGGHIRGPGND